jgi:hypothetical protein
MASLRSVEGGFFFTVRRSLGEGGLLIADC